MRGYTTALISHRQIPSPKPHQTCGCDLDSAYRTRRYGDSYMSLDDAVIDWMKEDFFINGNYMTYTYAGYQPRS